jgi:hypothetical protein
MLYYNLPFWQMQVFCKYSILLFNGSQDKHEYSSKGFKHVKHDIWHIIEQVYRLVSLYPFLIKKIFIQKINFFPYQFYKDMKN